MIDNRPVYNYFNGGTFWETLPIDLNDVERIEVIRGASSALYGPNAAAGVVNIITKTLNKEGVNILSNAQLGTHSTMIANSSIGYKKDKFNINISGNYQTRNREENYYYDWSQDKKVIADSIKSYYPGGVLTDLKGKPNAKERYPNTSLALNKVGYNLFLNYDINKDKNRLVSISMGGQKSIAQKAFAETIATPLTTMESSSNYINGNIKYGNFNFLLADQFGEQNVVKGSNSYSTNFNTLDAVAEYDIKIKKVTIKPGINFRNATYDDSEYTRDIPLSGFINGNKSLTNIAGSLRLELKPIENLKLIAALRTDKYNYPEKTYNSYQFCGNYKLTQNNILRATYSRAYRGPTMYDTYNSQKIYVGNFEAAPGMILSRFAVLDGNKNIELQKIDLIEIGYRSKLNDNFHLDADAFYQTSQDFSQPIGSTNDINPNNPSEVLIKQSIDNIPLSVAQLGITISANLIINKLQFKPFITFQKTELYKVSRYRDGKEAEPIKNIYNTYDTTNLATPTAFGGFYLNYQINKKFNANITSYFYSEQYYNNLFSNFDQDYKKNNGIVHINGKCIVNAKFSYKPIDTIEMFINVKNALNQKSYEYVNTDITGFNILIGASFNY